MINVMDAFYCGLCLFAVPGKGSPLAVLHRCSPSHNPLSPVLGPSPRPLSSPSISICKITLSANRTDGGDTGDL